MKKAKIDKKRFSLYYFTTKGQSSTRAADTLRCRRYVSYRPHQNQLFQSSYRILPMNTAPDINIDEIYSLVRKRILHDTYQSGEKLSENSLAKEFECSRTPIRETLKRLEQDGLVVIQPKSGTYIRHQTEKDYRDLIEVRSYIEGLSARLAIEKGADTTKMKKTLDDMDKIVAKTPVDIISFGEKHYAFHRTLIELSENELAVQLFDRLNLKSSHLFYQAMNEKAVAITQKEHRLIIEYIDTRNPKGEKFVIRHLWNKKRSLPL